MLVVSWQEMVMEKQRQQLQINVLVFWKETLIVSEAVFICQIKERRCYNAWLTK